MSSEIISIVQVDKDFFAGHAAYLLPQSKTIIYTNMKYSEARDRIFDYGQTPETIKNVQNARVDNMLSRLNPPALTITVFPGEKYDTYLIYRRRIRASNISDDLE